MKSWSIRKLIESESRTPDEIRDVLYLFRGDKHAKHSRFWLLLVLAIVIATAGILSDSTVTVIGAMIIAPLAIPIQGVAAAIAFGEGRALSHSGLTLVSAIAFVIGLGALLAWILPDLVPLESNSEITGRVSPTIIDLVAAAGAGLAGAVAMARRDIGDILPGVAIAISLVPPLIVVGITAISGDWSGSLGAFILFATNMLAIIVVCTLLFSALRVRYGGSEGATIRPAFSVVAIASLVVVAALAAATYRTIELANWKRAAGEVGAAWAERNDEKFVKAHFHGHKLVVLIEGMTDGSQDHELTRLLAGRVPAGTPVIVNRVGGHSREVGEVPGERTEQ